MEDELDSIQETTRRIAEWADGAQNDIERTRQMIRDPASILRKHELVHEKLADDPLITFRQRELFWYWEMFGAIGLGYYIQQIARYERQEDIKNGIGLSKRKRASSVDSENEYEDPPGGHISWTKLADDLDDLKTSRCYFYLLSTPPEIITALIRGDLSGRMQEPEFRDKYGEHLACQRTQGTYIVPIVRILPRESRECEPNGAAVAQAESPTRVTEDTVGAPQVASGVGSGFTWAELIQIAKGIEHYINIGNKESADFARNIDGMIHPPMPKLRYASQRKYAGGGEHRDNFDAHEKWVDTIRYLYLYWALQLEGTEHEHLLHKPMKRCLNYGGLSYNVQKRTNTHMDPGAAGTRLLGLILALCEYYWPGAFDVKGNTYQIIKTVDVSDIGLDEILTCTLTSSNGRDGGLNMSCAGGSVGSRVDRSTPSYIEGLHQNAMSISEDVQNANITESCEKIAQVAEQLKLVAQNNAACETLEAELAEDSERIAQLADEAKWIKAKAEHDALESLLSALRLENLMMDRVDAFGPE